MGDYWKFLACIGLMCVFYPPFLGFVIGVGGFIGLWFIIYSIIRNI